MKNHKFIKLSDCNDVKDLNISIDSIECFFKSTSDHRWTGAVRSEGNEYKFIKLKTGVIFEVKESPDIISKLIQ